MCTFHISSLQGAGAFHSLVHGFIYNMILLVLFIAGVTGQDNLRKHPQKRFALQESNLQPPEGFPLDLTLTNFVNWAHDIITCFVWTAYPRDGNDVVAATNWAMVNKYDLHASGNMHSWSPLTVAKTEEHPAIFSCGKGNGSLNQQIVPHHSSRVILLKTEAMNRIQVTSSTPGDSYFWTEPGASLVQVMQELEKHNLSIMEVPASGNVTIGGVLAVGAHGTGVPARGQVLSKGHTCGSLSNLIMSFTAVVYNGTLGEYVLKEFQRSDPEAQAFLVSLGRTFITNFTLRAGPLEFLRCESHVKIPVSSLFSPTDGPDSVSAFLSKYGRVEMMLMPFTTHPWLKVWSVAPEKPKNSREVTEPFNYPFQDSIPQPIALIMKIMVEKKLYNYTRPLAKASYASIVAGLAATNSFDIWGPSKNTLIYVRSSTARGSANGFAVVTSRANVQRALHDIYRIFDGLLHSYEGRGLYPVNGPIEFRITGLDNPEDVLVDGAGRPCMSTLGQVEGSDFDTAIWLAISTFYRTPSSWDFMRDFELAMMRVFNGEWAIARVEWVKCWAYTEEGPWTDRDFFNTEIVRSYNASSYEYFVETVVKYDPYFVFTNEFTRSYFI